jgi:hypothetical protein
MPVYFEVTLCLFVKAGRFNKPSVGLLILYNRVLYGCIIEPVLTHCVSHPNRRALLAGNQKRYGMAGTA